MWSPRPPLLSSGDHVTHQRRSRSLLSLSILSAPLLPSLAYAQGASKAPVQQQAASQCTGSAADLHAARTTIVLDATNLLGENLYQYWGGGQSRPRDIRYQDQIVSFSIRVKL